MFVQLTAPTRKINSEKYEISKHTNKLEKQTNKQTNQLTKSTKKATSEDMIQDSNA